MDYTLIQKLIFESELIIDEFPELFLVDLTVKGVSEKDLIEGTFNLEVSSPGIDKPISLPRQYKKNIGRKLEVETLDGEIFEGELKKIEEQTIALYLKERVETIFLDKIKKAKALISFN